MKLSLVRSAQTVRTRRRGSILIFVVALVVLLALIGTAFLTTTGTDRQSAGQHANNVQIDLITEGVANSIMANITGDLYGAGRLRNVADKLVGIDAIQLPERFATDPITTFGATPFTQRYLTSRVPQKFDPTSDMGTYLTTPPVWRAISAPLYNNGFTSPRLIPQGPAVNQVTSQTFNRQDQAIPYTAPIDVTGNGAEQVPLLRFQNAGSPAVEQYFGADADGDGIPDSGYCEVPIGTINGVTYFAAYRVIDNNAAINVNTALSRDKDFTLVGSTDVADLATLPFARRNNTGIPSRVGLGELLAGSSIAGASVNGGGTDMGDDFERLTRWHLGINGGGAWRNSAVAIAENGSTYGNYGTVHTFDWFSLGDMLSQQLGRRVENPGPASGTFASQRFGLSEGLSLVTGFVVKSDSSNSRLEETLLDTLNTSTFTFIPTTPYALTDLRPWFTDNFNYFDGGADTGDGIDGTTPIHNRRPLLVTDNPTSLLIPVRQDGLGAPIIPTAILNSLTATDNTPAVYRQIVSPFGSGRDQKIDVNQASFSELWYGFWRLMSDEAVRNQALTYRYTASGSTAIADFLPQSIEQAVSKADLTAPDTDYDNTDLSTDPFLGMEFQQVTAPLFTPGTTAASGPLAPQNAARMFRSTIRDPRASDFRRVLTLPSMQILRSAIAASNAVSLRAGVTETQPEAYRRWPEAPVATATPTLDVINTAGTVTTVTTVHPRIYGYQPQPFITEIYANTEATVIPAGAAAANAGGFVAIELYNPYDYDIDASTFAFIAVAKGTAPAYAQPLTPPTATQVFPFNGPGVQTAFSDGGSTPTLPPDFATPMTIPARGWLVIQNVAVATGAAGSQNNRPLATGMPVVGGFLPATQTFPVVPPATGPARLTVNYAFMPNMDLMLDREVVLVRGGVAAGSAIVVTPPGTTPGVYTYPALPATAAVTLANTIPLDAYDFTGVAPGSTGTNGVAWSYQRGSGAGVGQGGRWGCVYPGRYYAGTASVVGNPRQQGTATTPLDRTAAISDPWQAAEGPPGREITLHTNFAATTPTSVGGSLTNASVASYPSNYQIQLGATDWPGKTPNGKTVSVTEDGFFEGFQRIGDLLQVPFAGSYVLMDGVSTTDVVEAVPITMDIAFCEDSDPRNDSRAVPIPAALPSTTADDLRAVDTRDAFFYEAPGRFTPLVAAEQPLVAPFTLPALNPILFNDVSLDRGSYDTVAAVRDASDFNPRVYHLYRNRWSSHLFDYFATSTPSSDSSPGSVRYNEGTAAERQIRAVRNGVALADNTNLIEGTLEANSDDIAGGDRSIRTEDNVGVHGLININTADAKVLSMLPWFGGVANNHDIMGFTTSTTTPATPASKGQIVAGPNGIPDSVDLARAIVYYRDFKQDNAVFNNLNPGGPFLTPFDLYRIPAFREAQMIVLADREPADADGDASPYDTVAATSLLDNTRLDFEEQYWLLNRVSNLVTVRSDSYTVYMLVQGWRNAYTSSAELVTQRRQAFTVDRSNISATNGRPAKNIAPTP